MRRDFFSISFTILAALLIIGCASPYTIPQQDQQQRWDGNLVHASYTIANKLEINLKSPIAPTDPLIVASFVNVNNLEESSTFGRVLAEQIGSRFSQNGYSVIEMKLRHESIFIDNKRKGEFLLSRDLRQITRSHNAAAVIVGTYGRSLDRIYVSARIVDPTSSVVLAACDFGIPMDYKEQEALMKD